jgi:glycosyltransferase involved in cell wall biosynthesis
VLTQTYRDFELIVIDDGSTDGSADIIREFKDPRIKLFCQANHGLAATLNRAIELSKGKYLARHDQDDVAYPQRFATQIEFLEAHPDYAMVGTWAAIWDQEKGRSRFHKHPTDSLVLKFELLFDNPFVHSTMMIQKASLMTVGPYSTDDSRQPPEDYELWSRIARKFEVANIPEILQAYRETPGSMSRIGLNPFLDRLIDISAENIAIASGRDKPDQLAFDLSALAHRAYHRVSSRPSLREISDLLMEALRNLRTSYYSPIGVLRAPVELRLQSIRQSYYQYRYGMRLGRIMALLDQLLKQNSALARG